MKNYLSLFLCLSALVFLSACKKESNKIDTRAVKLVMDNVIIDDSSFSEYRHKLQGTIIAPGGLEYDEYGFFLKKDFYTQFLKIGSGKKVGNVSTEHRLPMRLNNAEVTLYAIIDGDTLTSQDVLFSVDSVPGNPPPSVPVSIAPTGTNSANTPGYESFIVNVFNYDTVNYVIVAQGVEFALGTDYAVNPVYTFYHMGDPITSSYPITNLYMLFPQNYFLPDTFYNYRAFVIVNHVGTSEQTYVYGNHNNFTTQLGGK